MPSTLLRLVLLFVLVGSAASAQSASLTVYDGLNRGSAGIRDFYDTTDVAGIRINTGASAYTINSVDLMLAWNAAPFNAWPSGLPGITVYGILPGDSYYRRPDPAQVVGSLRFDSVIQPRGTLSATNELVQLVPDVALTLAANTEYWFVMSMASGDGMSILGVAQSGNTAIGVFNENILGSGFNGVADNFNVSGGGYALRIEATPVSAIPEPSTYALLAGGCGLIALVLRRRRPAVRG